MEITHGFGSKLAQLLGRAIRSPRNETLASTAQRVGKKKPTGLVSLVSYLRWAIPVAVSFVGIGYILVEQVVIGRHSISEPTVIRALVIIGSAGPALVWITLTWAARATMAQAQAMEELALRNAQARRRALHLQTASLVGQRATALLDLDSMLAEVVGLIRDKFGYYQCHIMLVDSETKEIVLKEASGPRADIIKAKGLRLKVGEEGITGWVTMSGQPVLCNDVSQEPRFNSSGLVPETKSELTVPLRAGSRIVGVLDVQGDQLNAFDREDLTVLQILGNQIGVAIENARLFQETKRRYNAMIALHDTSLDMIAQLEGGDLFEALLRRSAHLLGGRASSLFTYDSRQKLIMNVAAYNTARDLKGVTVQLGEGLIGRVIQTGDPLIVNDYENWEGKAQIFTGDPETRGVGAPLRWEDQIIGGILVMNDASARPFDQDDVWLLSMFADLASIAVKNSELHSRVKDFNQQLEVNIAQRVEELSRAKEEIVEKAEQLKSLLAKTIHLQEEERARIARDMHDGVVQLITSARFEIQAARVVSGSNLPTSAQKKLTAAREVLEEAEGEIRRAIYDLHSPVLDAVGLVPALHQHIGRFESFSGIACDILVNGEVYRLPAQTEVAVFRIIEEALNNVAAHADASRASVQLDFGTETILVSIRDNGRGFDYKEWSGHPVEDHLGLLGMQERVESLSGEMQVFSEPELGTRIYFRLPV